MGQLEKYGLYVLCLVIFLILGVAIWGEPAAASPGQREDIVAMRVGGVGSAQVGNVIHARKSRSSANPSGVSKSRSELPETLNELLGPELLSEELVTSVPVNISRKAPVKNPVTEVTDKSKPVADVSTKPDVAATRDYTVKKNETLGHIALKQLGSTRYVKWIQTVNPGLTDRITIGQVIKLPVKKSSRSRASAVLDNSVRVYTICSGDNFSKIAKVELGDETRYQELVDLNPNVNPNALPIGKRVKLPLK